MKKTVKTGEAFSIKTGDGFPEYEGVYVNKEGKGRLLVITKSETQRALERGDKNKLFVPALRKSIPSIEDWAVLFATLLVGFTMGVIFVIIFAENYLP